MVQPMSRLYAQDLEAAIVAAIQDRRGYSRAEVQALFPSEPVEAIGRALQRLARKGSIRSAGYRASTKYEKP